MLIRRLENELLVRQHRLPRFVRHFGRSGGWSRRRSYRGSVGGVFGLSARLLAGGAAGGLAGSGFA